ncbi:hypothetical protein HJG60_009120 [Phyllostomus discolor]|uniref:Uncharacterized protein n=1 Tax=Phyllostomus discolor TaxID=89673 RepID=A0A833YFE7_9CHIR|nr:hypothetical protein HJG60_009120 [Phyllostomus discolor]
MRPPPGRWPLELGVQTCQGRGCQEISCQAAEDTPGGATVTSLSLPADRKGRVFGGVERSFCPPALLSPGPESPADRHSGGARPRDRNGDWNPMPGEGLASRASCEVALAIAQYRRHCIPVSLDTEGQGHLCATVGTRSPV